MWPPGSPLGGAGGGRALFGTPSRNSICGCEEIPERVSCPEVEVNSEVVVLNFNMKEKGCG